LEYEGGGGGDLGDDCTIIFIFGVVLKITQSELLPGDIVKVRNLENEEGSISGKGTVVGLPNNLSPLELSLSGPQTIQYPVDAKLCWEATSTGDANRGIFVDFSSTDNDLNDALERENNGEEVVSVCVEKEFWDGVDGDKFYVLSASATSQLFNTKDSETFEFFFFRSGGDDGNRRRGDGEMVMMEIDADREEEEKENDKMSELSILVEFDEELKEYENKMNRKMREKGMKRKAVSCEALWDFDPNNVYSMRLYPSGKYYIPSGQRSLGLEVTLKVMTGCKEFAYAREMLLNGTIKWEFLNQDIGLNPDEFSTGTRFVLPSNMMENHDYFPANVPVHLRVTVVLENGDEFVEEVEIVPLSGPVVIQLQEDLETVFPQTERLIIDASSSYPIDNPTSDAEGTWSWKWTCIDPRTQEFCVYSDGSLVQFPSNENIFRSDPDKNFKADSPMWVVIRNRYISPNNAISYGKLSLIFNPVSNDTPLVSLSLVTWECPLGETGYLVRVDPLEEKAFRKSAIQSVWTKKSNDFGNLQLFEADEGHPSPEIRCSCGSTCSEARLFYIQLELESGEPVNVYAVYEPVSVTIPPSGGTCQFETQNYEGIEGIVSTFTFVSVSCQGWTYQDSESTIVSRIWYEVKDNGEGPIPEPKPWPTLRPSTAPRQFLLPCGDSIVIYAEIIGVSATSKSTLIEVCDLSVDSWNDADESSYIAMNNIIDDAPNWFVRFNRIAATLQTTSSPCFPDGTFNPLDENEILNDILSSPPPNNPSSVIEEASLLSLVTDVGNTEQNLEVLDRYEGYFDVLNEEGTLSEITETSEYVVDGLTGILDGGNQDVDSVLDGVYDVIGIIETSLLCKLKCGEDTITIESALISLAATHNTLEAIGDITEIGNTGAGFQLPSNIEELEDQLGITPGQCVSSGSSVVENANGLPVTSLTFYVNDCNNSREITIFGLTDEFLIVLPIDRPEDDTNPDCAEDSDEGEDDEATCFFGDTLSNVSDTEGCHVADINETHVTCACTHLTAFSALFVPGRGGGGGGPCGDDGGWKWDILKTIAASLMAFALFLVVGIILFDHFVIHRSKARSMVWK